MKLTTSELSTVEADIRVCLRRSHPIKYNRCFLGFHLDFSMHQMILYLGICYLFIEVYGPKRGDNATIDSFKPIWKGIVWHSTNHQPHDYFFNMGVTFDEGVIVLFFWKLQLAIKR